MTPGFRIGASHARSIFVLVIACLSLVSVALAENPSSLKDKSNEELLHTIIGGKSEQKAKQDAEVETHLPEHFWEMAAKDAALALIEANCPPQLKQTMRFVFDVDANRQPPDKGQIGLRWECSHCILAERGATILNYSHSNSVILYSRVKLLDPWNVDEPVLKRALDQTKRISLSEGDGRQLYEIIWWLCHVRAAEPAKSAESTKDGSVEVISSGVTSTGDGQGTFWALPDLRRTKVRLYGGPPISDYYVNGVDKNLYATFAELLLSDVLERQGADIHSATATVGRERRRTTQERLVAEITPPPPQDVAASDRWVGRMVGMLRKPKDVDSLEIVDLLVPWEEPMRFKDKRIDVALMSILQADVTKSTAPSSRSAAWQEASSIARPIAWRDQSDSFPLFLKMLRQRSSDTWYGREDIVEAAALIASKHAEFRPMMIDYLRDQLADLSASPDSVSNLFDVIWRNDFRELRPILEKLATSSENEMEDPRAHSRSDPPQPVTGRFHDARKILLAWSEPDDLTRLKLNAIIEVSSSVLLRVAPFLQTDFKSLSHDEQPAFCEFVKWMRQQKIKYDWSPDKLEKHVSCAVEKPAN